MSSLKWFWERFEECLISILLAIMTLVTFFYVVFNNLYNVFFDQRIVIRVSRVLLNRLANLL